MTVNAGADDRALQVAAEFAGAALTAIRPACGTTLPSVVVTLRGMCGFSARCRVVWVVDEADRAGFAYGTVRGHPESGEEAFVVERDAGGEVWLSVRAFSRAATRYARAGGPVTWLVRRWITERYLRAV